MAVIKTGLSYYKSDTDRYQDIKIKRLKRSFSGNGIAVYDYILNEVYRVQGCFLEWDENTAFDVAEYFGLKENLVDEIVKYCASVGLFDKELLCRGIITSRPIQERYLQACFQAKRKNVTIPAEIRLTEESENTPEESENTPEVCDKEKKRKVKESKVKESKYTLPREDINLNNSNTHTRGGGNIKNLYQELSKYAQIPEDVWDAAAITGSFQNDWARHYQQWLSEDEDTRRPLHEINEHLRKYCGEVNTEFYHAIGWCKDNLMQDQYTEIFRLVVSKPAALTELRKCIKEIKKGGIKQPGLFIFSKLNKL